MVRRLLLAGFVSSCAIASAAAAEGGGASIIEPKVGTIFWTLVTFLLLAFVLGRYAWKPLLGALDDRQRSIEESLSKAKSEREQAARMLEEHKALVAQAHRERAEAVAKGEQDAEKLKAEILAAAREQREQLLKQTEDQISTSIKQARESLRSTTASLAIRAAEKLLARDLDDATHRRLVEEYLAGIEDSSRGAGAASG